MSFKDDFFEALRSVKRDLFRDVPPEQDNETGAQRQYAQDKPAAADDKPANQAQASSEPLDEIYPSQPDDFVYEAFRQASTVEEDSDQPYAGDDDAGNDAAEDLHIEDESSYTSKPFSDFSPPEIYGTITENSAQLSTNEGRKIYDFDANDLYDDDKTIISRNTIIRGAIHTDDSLRLLGQVMGDIECRSNIVVAGKVRGNTTAANAYIIDAQIDGNMLCDDSINVNKDAWILGNIRAQQAEIDGKIKGNIEIRHAVSIGSASSVIGNISTDELEVKRGAFVNGQIIMYSPSRDVIDRFDDFDR